VLISASTNVYKEIIISAVKKGKHVFCEKLIDLTFEFEYEPEGGTKEDVVRESVAAFVGEALW
jgi:hypothetical protein